MSNKDTKDRLVDAWLHDHSDGIKFVAKTVIYVAIMIALVYLYDYSGVSGTHFIYNEF